MKFNGVFSLVVTVLVVVILAAVVIVPVVQEAQSGETTQTSNTGGRFSVSINTDDINLAIDVIDVDTKTYSINGDTRVATYYEKYFSDIFVINPYAGTINGVGLGNSVSLTNGDKVTVVDGAFTFTPSASSTVEAAVTGTVSMLIAYDTNGDWLEFTSTGIVSSAPKIDNNVTFYGYSTGGGVTTLIWELTRTTSSIIGQYSGVNPTTYDASLTFTTTDYNRYAFTVDSATAVVNNNTPNGTSLFIPAQYTVVDKDSIIYVMLGIIPTLVLLIPIMIVVRSFAKGRD